MQPIQNLNWDFPISKTSHKLIEPFVLVHRQTQIYVMQRKMHQSVTLALYVANNRGNKCEENERNIATKQFNWMPPPAREKEREDWFLQRMQRCKQASKKRFEDRKSVGVEMHSRSRAYVRTVEKLIHIVKSFLFLFVFHLQTIALVARVEPCTNGSTKKDRN